MLIFTITNTTSVDDRALSHIKQIQIRSIALPTPPTLYLIRFPSDLSNFYVSTGLMPPLIHTLGVCPNRRLPMNCLRVAAS